MRADGGERGEAPMAQHPGALFGSRGTNPLVELNHMGIGLIPFCHQIPSIPVQPRPPLLYSHLVPLVLIPWKTPLIPLCFDIFYQNLIDYIIKCSASTIIQY